MFYNRLGGGAGSAKELLNASGSKIADLESRGSGKVSVVGGLGNTPPEKVLQGSIYSDESGVRRTGTMEDITPDLTTQSDLIKEIRAMLVGRVTEANATPEDILKGKKAYVGEKLVVGTYVPPPLPPLPGMTPSIIDDLGKKGSKQGNDWVVDGEVVMSIGETINIKLTTGETITMVLADLNHDDLTSGGKAPFTFIMQNCLNAQRQINSTNTNSGGWKNTAMRTWCNGTLFSQFPAEWQNVIKQVNKKGYSGTTSTINTTADKLWLLAETEAFGTNHYSYGTGEGTRYPIFTNDASRTKKVNGSSSTWWLRSPHSDYESNFCSVSAGGGYTYIDASGSSGVAVGFCV